MGNCNCEPNTYHLNLGCVVPALANPNAYYTKSEVDEKLEDIIASGCCITPEEVDEKIESAITDIDLSEYAKKSEMPTVPTKVSAFENDVPYLTQHQSLSGYVTDAELSAYTYDKATIDEKVASGGTFDPTQYYTTGQTDNLLSLKLDASAYTPTDLSNYYNKTEVENIVNSAKTEVEGEIPSLSGYATEQWVLDKHYISGVDLSDYALKSEIPTVPTSNSAFTNDMGYLTEHQSLEGYATEQWVTDQGYLTEHQQLKTINNESLIGEGNITISSSTVDLSNYYNKQEIDAMLDDKATQTWVLNQHYVTNSELIQYITNLQNQINYLQTTISGCCGGGTGETAYRWITMTGENDYECSGTTKYTKEKRQQSTDGGNTWTDVTPAETRRGNAIIEENSVDCGYVPTNLKFSGVLYNGNTFEVPCNSSSTLTTAETRTTNAYTSIEIGDCVSVIGEGALRSQVYLRGSLVLPSSIRTIEKDAFTNCGKLSGVTLNDGLETLGEGVFKYCTGLTTVNIPNSVTSIGKQTFYLDKFNTVTIGSGITSIGLGAFEASTEDAQNREYVKILATTPPTLEDASTGSYTFNGSYPIYVPAASVNSYKSAWRGYASRLFPIQ